MFKKLSAATIALILIVQLFSSFVFAAENNNQYEIQGKVIKEVVQNKTLDMDI